MKPQLILGGLSGLSAVAIGAFGAHGVTDPQVEDWIRTGVQYQLPHAAAVFGCFPLFRAGAGRPAQVAAWLFLAGSLLFSGSLYLIAATGVRTWGAVAPVGGALLMTAWGALAWAGLKADMRAGG